MKVLVTGGAGYLGCVFVWRLLEAQFMDVTVVDTLEHNRSGILGLMRFKNLQVIQQDATDCEIDQYDFIVNLAAISGEPACRKYKDRVLPVNVTLPLRLAKDMAEDQFLVHASTTAVYGDARGKYIDRMKPAPANKLGRYAGSKLLAETELSGRRNVAVVRIPTMYGLSPAMRPGMLIHDMCRQALDAGKVVLYGGVQTRRPIGHVEGVASALFEVMHKAQAGAHILAAENLTKAEIADRVARAAGVEVVLTLKPDLQVQDHAVQNTNLRRFLVPSLGRILQAYRMMAC